MLDGLSEMGSLHVVMHATGASKGLPSAGGNLTVVRRLRTLYRHQQRGKTHA
jgi:hypothetical protein